MQSTTVSFKLIRKIKDDRFDEEKLHQYTLLTQLGVRDLQIAVVDKDGNRLVFFEDYMFNDVNSKEDLLEVVRQLYESHPLLMAGFWKNVVFGIKNNQLAQVPEPLFVEEGAAEYLKLNAQIDEERDAVLFCSQKRSEAVTVFGIDQALRQWIVSVYANCPVKFVHQSASLIEGVMAYAEENPGTPLYIYVDRFKMHIMSVKDNKLVYYNQFVIKQFSDYIKYIMLVMKGLNMDQATSQVILWGYIGKNSPHYQEFYKYIRNVVFGGRPPMMRFGYIFDDVQEHHFFDLFSMNLLSN